MIYGLFFLSGISGLIYQVIWVRQFGNIFGNTVHSAALVTAVFMCGLGVGSYAAGLYADRAARRSSLLAAYGGAEVVIGVLGLALALLLPHLAGLSASISSYVRTHDAMLELSAASAAQRYAVAVALLAPVTLLMGATLTLLVRHVIGSDLASSGVRVGALYGFNTAGAALGCLLSDLALIPNLGLLRTQFVAIAVNLAVGGVALALSRPAPKLAAQHPSSSPVHGGADLAESRGLVPLTAAALFLSGFAAMGLEIVWFRLLGGALGQFRSVFSMLLAVILVGIWLGSSLGGLAHRKIGRPELLFVVCQSLLAATTLGLLAWFDPLSAGENVRRAYASLPAPAELSTYRQYLALLRAMLPLVALPSILLGASFPLANANVQRVQASVGRRAGLLYLSNTLGAVLGSLIAGFVLLPSLGGQASALVMAALAGLAAVPFYLSTRGKLTVTTAPVRGDYVFLSGLAVSFGAVGAFALLPDDALLKRGFSHIPGYERVLVMSEGVNEVIAVTADPAGARRLWTNGHSMSSTLPSGQRYMRAFSHLPLLQLDEPRDVLVICFGVGNTLHAASLHPSVKRLQVADLSRHVLSFADQFSATNGGVLKDPRTTVFVNDGRQHLRMVSEASFDLITLEPPPIAFAGVAALYSTEFYQLARSRLKPGGFVTQWLPVYQVDGSTALSMVRAFIEVFPQSVLLSGYLGELILMGTAGPSIEVDPATLERNLQARPAVLEDARKVNLGTLQELVGTFVAGPDQLKTATAGSIAVTDDRPLTEYSVLSHYYRTSIPAALFRVDRVGSWCPGCTERIEALDTYLGLLGSLYERPAFLQVSTVDPPRPMVESSPYEAAGERAETISQSGYLRGFLRKSGTRGGAPPAPPSPGELAALESSQRASPESAMAMLRLGLARAASGDSSEAVKLCSRAAELEPRSAHARFCLGYLLDASGAHEGAAQVYSEGLSLAPRDAEARMRLAGIHHAMGHPEASARELSRVLELEPSFGPANAAVCSMSLRSGGGQDALPYCRRAIAASTKLDADTMERLEQLEPRP